MKLLIRKPIYRAFSELDEFPDEVCERFMASAAGSWRFRLTTIGVMVLFLFWGVVLTWDLASPYGSLLTVTLFGGADYWVYHLIAWRLAGLLLTGAVIFWTRDSLVRRSIRELLRERGTCRACRYSLVGLNVGPQRTVLCPECGLSIPVDPALGELVRDELGRQSVAPRQSPASKVVEEEPTP